MHQCPQCEKTFSRKDGLEKHIARMHKGDPPGDPVPVGTPAGGGTGGGKGEDLEITPPADAQGGGFHCSDCGRTGIPKDTPSCPGCGASLDWPGGGESRFKCPDCGAGVTKGDKKCPGCGTALEWEGVS